MVAKRPLQQQWLALVVVLLLVGAVLVAGIDPVAALVIGFGLLGIRFAVRHRSHRAVRITVGSVATLSVLGAVGVAGATVHWQVPRSPFVVPRAPVSPTSAAPRPAAGAGVRGREPSLEVLGFVDPDQPDSVAGEDRDAGQVSSLASTGVFLGPSPGTLVGTSSSDALLRAHLNGARAYLTVSNVDADTGDFNGPRADVVLASSAARGAVVAGIRRMVLHDGWDGVVLDLESLGAAGRGGLVALTAELHNALAGRPVTVAVPAWEQQDPSESAGIDLPGLAAAADRIVWMAYDEHDPSGSGPGPIGELPWVRSTLRTALTAVPAHKLLLGVAGYGYAWPRTGPATELTFSDLRTLAARPGARATYDPKAGEEHVIQADGAQAWFQTADSLRSRSELAAQLHLAGIAMWRVGSEQPGSFGQVAGHVVRYAVATHGGRPIQQLGGAGAIALTFDDGPDATWTPKILRVLEQKHAPATFFAIGRQAEAAPDLVRQEVADGDVVGDHTYSHPDMNLVPEWRARLEMLAGQAVVEGISGRRPLLFRTPYGDGDVRVRGAASRDQLAVDEGFYPVNWTDDPLDWSRPGVQKIVDSAVAQASDSGVILLHDGGGDRSETVAALPVIIDRLRAQGYTFTTVDEVDGNIAQPYASPHTGMAKVREMVVVTGFRLGYGLTLCLRWLVLAVAVLSILRLVITLPLALVHRRRHRIPAAPSQEPGAADAVTVLIPAHNESAVIGKALAALASLPTDEAPDEVIVVDDGSSDDTATIAGSFPGVTVVRQDRGGKASALNTGIAHSRNEVLVVLDADTVVTRGMLPALAAHFAVPAVGAVAGNVKVGNRRGLLARLQAAEYITSLNLERRAQALVNAVTVVPGAAGAFRRRALFSVGGYPTETLVEDADLTVRLLRAGWLIPYESRAVAWTEAPQTMAHALRQRRRWAFGTVQLLTVHAAAIGRRRAGAIGSLGLPWVLVTQVLLPTVAPLADLYLLYLLVSGNAGPAAVTLIVSAILDLLTISAAVLVDREDNTLVLTAPALRWVWRPLLVVAVVGSVRRWLRGDTDRWTPSRRYASVRVPMPRPAGSAATRALVRRRGRLEADR